MRLLLSLLLLLATHQARAQSNVVLTLEWKYYVTNLTSDLSFQIVTNNLANPTNWQVMKAIRATQALQQIVNFTNTYQVATTSSVPFNFFSVRASNQFGISGLATK